MSYRHDYETERLPGALIKLGYVILVLSLIGLLLTSFGCSPKGYVRASEIKPGFEKVRERHDAYVLADPTLSPLEKRIATRTTTLIGLALDRATKD